MGLMTMDKSLIGAGLMMVVLNLAVIAPMATGDMMVTAVNEGMSDLYLEGCVLMRIVMILVMIGNYPPNSVTFMAGA